MRTLPVRSATGTLLFLTCVISHAQFRAPATLSRESNGVALSWESVPGARYRLFTSTNLSQPNAWRSLPNPVEALLNLTSVRTPIGPNELYFQVQEQEPAPPQAWLRSPSDRAVASGTNNILTIPLFSTAPIDTNSITLSVAAGPVLRLPDPRLRFDGGTLIYTPLPGETLGGFGETVSVSLSASDVFGNALENLTWTIEIEPPPVVTPNVVVVSNLPPGLVLDAITGNTFYFVYSGASSGLATGNVLVSGKNVSPLFRREVISFTELPNNLVAVETADAAVNHGLTSGGAQINGDFSNGDFTAAGAFRLAQGGQPEAAAPSPLDEAVQCCAINLSNRIVLSNAFLRAETPTGRLSFAPLLALRGKFGAAGLTAADLEFGGRLGLDLAFRATALAPGGYTNTIPLGIARQPVRLDLVGTVPVWAEAQLSFALGVESDWRGTGAVSMAIQSTNLITVQAQLRGGAWSNSASRILTGRIPAAPGWTTNLEARVRVFVEVTLALELDDQPGPVVQVRPFVEAEGFAYAPPGFAGYEVSLDEGLLAHVALDLRNWDALAPVQSAVEVFRARTRGDHTIRTVPIGRALRPIPDMAWIPPGRFTMGRDVGPPTTNCDCPPTDVTLTRGFYLGRREVTQHDYLSLMGTNPSVFPGGPFGTNFAHPVENVTWADAMEYCFRLTEREQQAHRLSSNFFYRLPTEAEWEYACRARSTNVFHYGDALRPGMANFDCTLDPQPCTNNPVWLLGYVGRPTPAGLFAPNAWGLHDLHGNVAEWCLDWLGDQLPGGMVDDLEGPPGMMRALRGGSFGNESFACRSSARLPADFSTARSGEVGFRVLLRPPRVELYTLTVGPGYTLIANQLDRGSNTLAEVLSVVPNGSHLLKYMAGNFTSNNFQNGWDMPGATLAPGEGAFLYLPTTVTQAIQLTFTGVRRVLPMPPALVQGFQLLSRQTPEVGTYEDITLRVPAEGAMLLRWTPSQTHPATGSYTTYVYSGGAWLNADTLEPEIPIIPRGEAVFIYQP